MGNEIYGVDIAGIIADVFDGELLDATVTRFTRGARDPNKLTAGRPLVPTEYPGITGFWEDFKGTPPPGVTVLLNDRKAVLIGDTIPPGGIPERFDMITMEGQSLYVQGVLSRDPAGAVYVYHCGDRKGPDAA